MDKTVKGPPGNALTRLATDPRVPYTLSMYLQLFFNIVIVSIICPLIYTFVQTVLRDVQTKVDEFAVIAMHEMIACEKAYQKNKCGSGRIPPALEEMCLEWERCMAKNPNAIGRAKVGAQTFAEIINGFVEPISYKAIFFFIMVTFGSIALNNVVFRSYRRVQTN